jgi:hypothetical protein
MFRFIKIMSLFNEDKKWVILKITHLKTFHIIKILFIGPVLYIPHKAYPILCLRCYT